MERPHARGRPHGMHAGGLRAARLAARRVDAHPALLPQRPVDRQRAPAPLPAATRWLRYAANWSMKPFAAA